jgi:hypothetical protein
MIITKKTMLTAASLSLKAILQSRLQANNSDVCKSVISRCEQGTGAGVRH